MPQNPTVYPGAGNVQCSDAPRIPLRQMNTIPKKWTLLSNTWTKTQMSTITKQRWALLLKKQMSTIPKQTQIVFGIIPSHSTLKEVVWHAPNLYTLGRVMWSEAIPATYSCVRWALLLLLGSGGGVPRAHSLNLKLQKHNTTLHYPTLHYTTLHYPQEHPKDPLVTKALQIPFFLNKVSLRRE